MRWRPTGNRALMRQRQTESNFSRRRWPPHFYSTLDRVNVGTFACWHSAESKSDAAVAVDFVLPLRELLPATHTLQGPARRFGPRRTTSQ